LTAVNDDLSGGNGRIIQAVAGADVGLIGLKGGDAFANSGGIQTFLGKFSAGIGAAGTAGAIARGQDNASTKFSTPGTPAVVNYLARAYGAVQALAEHEPVLFTRLASWFSRLPFGR